MVLACFSLSLLLSGFVVLLHPFTNFNKNASICLLTCWVLLVCLELQAFVSVWMVRIGTVRFNTINFKRTMMVFSKV